MRFTGPGRLPAVLAGVVLGACAAPAADDSRVIRVDSAGVEIVTSPAVDARLDWRFEEELRLGGAEAGPEAFDIVTANTIAADAEDRLYVLDVRGRRVIVFTAGGEMVREMGRQGGGPGEMRSPASLAVAPDGTVSVFDFGKGGLVRFSPSGAVLEERTFRFFPALQSPRHLAASEGGLLVASMLESAAADTFRYGIRMVTARDTALVAELRIPTGAGMMQFPSCGGGLNLPRLFEPELVWGVAAPGVVVSRTAAYDVEVFLGGSLVRRIRRGLDVRPATDEAAVAELGEGFTISFNRGPCTIPPREMVDRRGYAPAIPWIAGVTVAPDGEVWARRRSVGPRRRGADGRLRRFRCVCRQLARGHALSVAVLERRPPRRSGDRRRRYHAGRGVRGGAWVDLGPSLLAQQCGRAHPSGSARRDKAGCQNGGQQHQRHQDEGRDVERTDFV